MRNLADLLENLYGVHTTYRENPVTATLGVASGQILPYNPKRVGFIVVNLSPNSVYVAPKNTVSITSGIYLAANGGSLSLVWDRDFELCANDWYGIATGAGSAIYLLEISMV